MSDSILYEKDDSGILKIVLNEPKSLNALSAAVKSELQDSLIVAAKDDSIKIVIISGNGRSFCAGGDVKSMGGKNTPLQNKERITLSGEIIKLIRNLNKPVISVVHGHAAGAGFSLAISADIVIAERNTKFGLAFRNIGLVPDMGLHYLLNQTNMTPWKIKELIWKGARITVEEALDYGFVNYIVEDGLGMEKGMEVANALVNGPTNIYGFSKNILNGCNNNDLDNVLELEGFAQSVLKETLDHKEAVQAFKRKSKPVFRGE